VDEDSDDVDTDEAEAEAEPAAEEGAEFRLRSRLSKERVPILDMASREEARLLPPEQERRE
jgi:hypothetical protein